LIKDSICALAVMLCATAALAGSDDREIADQLRALEDPSILKRRVWLDTEWNSFKDSSDDVDFTFGGLWAWGVSDNQDWAVRLKVPVRFHMAGNAAGDLNEQGLGDIKLAAGCGFPAQRDIPH
jgi:hypothetical protein